MTLSLLTDKKRRTKTVPARLKMLYSDLVKKLLVMWPKTSLSSPSTLLGLGARRFILRAPERQNQALISTNGAHLATCFFNPPGE